MSPSETQILAARLRFRQTLPSAPFNSKPRSTSTPRVGVHLIHRRDEGFRVLEIRGEPDPGHLQREKLLARFLRGGGARELGATARVLTALFWIAWHSLLRQILTDYDSIPRNAF